MITRTKLANRVLPDYTMGEEIFNMVTHIVGGVLGIVVLVLCVIKSALCGNVWGVIGGAIYGASMIILYTSSSVYHGLKTGMAKKVMQVIDHCTIYFLISGTYTPILFCAIRPISRLCAWAIFGFVWGLAVLACTLTAIDLKKYSTFSMTCYILMGWCIMLSGKIAVIAMDKQGFLLLLSGGIVYSIGAVLYGLGKKTRYMHSVFHIFVVLGSFLQFLCVYNYIL